ncbi:GAF and ANTAR domain-containing protein [Actinokineospora cianjurensis]|uniref:GAF domain-containing protein n=1 Tax=Actinokineospora cianjurensis TaxID=585224 RepID=A0A421B830_9PSEU|nr:GAF and ANTAR domain-containing protein [Actinokineospora cianjurensis]RLK60666.1 GAF domain-containing protein [Actinokineospora cianjurensis]
MKQQRLVETLVELADTLIDDFDVLDFLQLLVDRCVELLAIDAAGILLATVDGELHMVTSSSEAVRRLELFQLRHDEGPCLAAYRSGLPVSRPDLTRVDATDARFASAAIADGYQAVFALPMRLRSETIGALNLFRATPGDLDDLSWHTAKALVDVATISLLQARAVRDHALLSEQLQEALTSRVIIEQAKGVLAERLGLDMAAAFDVLRGHARDTNTKLSELARVVVTETGWTPSESRRPPV